MGIGSGLGGAVYAGGLSIYICDSCEFTNNKAFQGGAVYITGDSRTEIRSSTFDSNTSSDNGSAFWIVLSNTTPAAIISQTTFTNN